MGARGATVTGVDYSEAAIAQARALAASCGIDARFAVSNIYDLPQNLDVQFDCRVHVVRRAVLAARPRALGAGRGGLRAAGRDVLHRRISSLPADL
ncbi:MAG: methyltransferase domain-containing protein [Dehalococcoidia bacterium]